MDILELLRAGKTSGAELDDYFDSLTPASIDFMIGTWAAPEHPAAPNGYYGMRFTDADTVDPLLIRTADGNDVFAADPVKAFPLMLQWTTNLSDHADSVRTDEPTGRLRMVEFRGIVSATMIYDRQPVLDHFRKIDDNTVLGAAENRGFSGAGFFALHRDA